MYLIYGHIVSSLYFALSTSSFTVLSFAFLNILYSYLLSGSGNKEIISNLPHSNCYCKFVKVVSAESPFKASLKPVKQAILFKPLTFPLRYQL